MKRILIFLMTLVTLAVTTPAFAAKRSIMELPPYERAVLIIKYHETLHDSRKHWPYLGYGHRKLPGEKYFRGYKMSERELMRSFAKTSTSSSLSSMSLSQWMLCF